MRCFFNLVLVLMVSFVSFGDVGAQSVPVAKAKAKAALMLANQDKCGCCDGVCDCPVCDCPVCDCEAAVAKAKAALLLKASAKEHECTTDLSTAMRRAEKEGRILMVWVGMTCVAAPGIRDAFPDAVHCHCDEMNGNAMPRLLVGPVPSNEYKVYPKTSFTPETPIVIRHWLAPPKTSAVPMLRQAASC